MCCESELSSDLVQTSEAVLTKANSDESVTYLPPLKPEGGDVYLFSPKNNQHAKGKVTD